MRFITIAALFVTLAAGAIRAGAQPITLKGSDTMLPLYTPWVQGYKRDHPGVKFDLQGGGSELGIAALFADKADIAAASRPLSGIDLQKFNAKFNALPLELIVGLDAMGVFIHEGNPISWLTMEELRGIFSGEITNWRDVRGVDRRIDVYTRNADSGTYAFFREVVLAGGRYSSRSRPLANTEIVTETVSRNQSAIGHGGIAYGRATRLIRICDPATGIPMMPSRENVLAGTYPLRRSLYFYVHPRALRPEVKEFLAWICGEPGQSIVEQVGYFPLPVVEQQRMLTEKLRWTPPTAPAAKPER